MTKKLKPPCPTYKLLEWLRDIECCCEKTLDQWLDIFRAKEDDRALMGKRYGDLERLVGLTTFVNFWMCRDLPTAKKLDADRGGESTRGAFSPQEGRGDVRTFAEAHGEHRIPKLLTRVHKVKELPGYEEMDDKLYESVQQLPEFS